MGTGTRGNRGSTAVEYAIILPAMLMFVLGLLDSGRLLWSYATLSRSVEAAARCAAVNTTLCGSTTATRTYAAGEAWGLALTASAFTATAATCGAQVAGTMNFKFVIPWFYVAAPFGASNAITLNATACYPT
jgi:Flp pilus assembly protein TadG